ERSVGATFLYPAIGRPPLPETPPLPDWIRSPFKALVHRPDGYFFAAYRTTQRSGHVLGVLTLDPLNSTLLDTWVDRLGMVAFHGTAAPPPRGANFALPPGRPPNPPVASSPKAARGLSSSSYALDRAIYVPATVAAINWQTGKPESSIVTVATRLSILNRRLFTSFVIGNDDVSRWPLLLLGAIGVVFGLIELVAMVAGVRLTRSITLAVDDLYLGTQRVNKGDLNHQIPIRHHDQLAALEESFNTMTASLQKLLEEQRETQKLEDDLAIAHEVQAQLFPQRASKVEGLEIYGRCVPARVVSGDYYDFLALGPEQVALALGDVSGKGISAALLMANIGAAVRAYQHQAPASAPRHTGGNTMTATLAPEAQLHPAELMERLNNQLHASTPVEKYATLFYAFYDGQRRTLRYTNAGHLPPAVIGRDGIRHLTRGGTVVGMFPNLVYEEGCEALSPGDLLVAWSDGISEPENEYGEEFGEARLLELVRTHAGAPLSEIVDIILREVRGWHGPEQEQPDDMTLVLARIS
ncbi:MAG: PP2C family protein-serine/threonine phosphatase, partial [Terriglobales bacterium]